MPQESQQGQRTFSGNNHIKVEINNVNVENGESTETVENVKKMLPMKYSALVVPANAVNDEIELAEETIVYFDQGSDESLMSTELFKSLKLKPLIFSDCTVTTVTTTEHFKDTPIVKFRMETIDKKKSFEIVCRVMDNIPQCNYKDPSEVVDQYSCFKDIKIPATSTTKVGLCIGRDYPDLLTYGKVIKAGRNKPIAYETVLGWSVTYPRKYDEDEDQNNIRINAIGTIKCTNFHQGLTL